MPISPEYLPKELHYIIPLAERHGSDARVSKFNRRLGRHVKPEEVKLTAVSLDWGKLPQSLRYLAGPAEVYGGYQFDEPIYQFLTERMTEDERVELRALSQRAGQDEEAINRWLDEFSMTEHPEARLVYFTRHLVGTAADMGLFKVK
jgi:hypothetical protein